MDCGEDAEVARRGRLERLAPLSAIGAILLKKSDRDGVGPSAIHNEGRVERRNSQCPGKAVDDLLVSLIFMTAPLSREAQGSIRFLRLALVQRLQSTRYTGQSTGSA